MQTITQKAQTVQPIYLTMDNPAYWLSYLLFRTVCGKTWLRYAAIMPSSIIPSFFFSAFRCRLPNLSSAHFHEGMFVFYLYRANIDDAIFFKTIVMQ